MFDVWGALIAVLAAKGRSRARRNRGVAERAMAARDVAGQLADFADTGRGAIIGDVSEVIDIAALWVKMSRPAGRRAAENYAPKRSPATAEPTTRTGV